MQGSGNKCLNGILLATDRRETAFDTWAKIRRWLSGTFLPEAAFGYARIAALRGAKRDRVGHPAGGNTLIVVMILSVLRIARETPDDWDI